MGLGNWFADKFLKVERDRLGSWSYWFGGKAFGSKHDFLEWSQSNPVLMTVIALRCKLYSQMEITAVNSKGESVDIPELALLYKPNYFQSKQDFFFQQMWFMSAMGDCYTYQKRPFQSETPKALYNLIPNEIDFKEVFNIDKFLTTQQDISSFEKQSFEYRLNNTRQQIMLRDVIPFYDLSSGLQKNGLMRSPSRIEGIKHVLHNIEENLKAKNINLQMSQKYIAANKSASDGTPQIQPGDREDIERKVGMKSLHVTNANVEVAHMVKDLKNLYLDPMFTQDALTVLLAFDMNKDVLNYQYGGASTFDNQNTGLIAVIQNSIQPSADNTMNSFTNSWKLDEKGIKLVASFNHLPIMQATIKTKIDTLNALSTMLAYNVEAKLMTEQEAKDQYIKTKNELRL